MTMTLSSQNQILGFYGTYTDTFKNLLSVLLTLLDTRLTHQIIDPDTLEKYVRAIAYDLEKLQINY